MVPENIRPAMIAPPSPCQRAFDNVIGINPRMAANEVSAIGSSRLSEASTIAVWNSNPAFKFWLILSTIRIEFFTTIPKSARIPISAGNESGVWVTEKTMNTPETESGITSITISAFLKEWNCSTMVIIINMNERSIASRIEVTDSLFCWFTPPVDHEYPSGKLSESAYFSSLALVWLTE